MTKTRKHHSPQDKVSIVKQHLIDKVPISDLADQHGVQPTQIYLWQKQLFENGAAAFQKPGKRHDDGQDRQIAALQEKLAKKNEVVAELMEEHVQLKKELGEL